MNSQDISQTSQLFDPIAIVGIGCRFPGQVYTPQDYWQLLCAGVDAITQVPEDRWNLQTFCNPDRSKQGKTYTRWGGFLDNVDLFDAQFFGISPREATRMDPQQRLLLETTWEALEDAGMLPEELAGSLTGVFVGLFIRDYEQLQLGIDNRHLIDAHTGVGVSMGIAANRISYAFDFQGPSMTLDTACSSSLVAIHLACQSLQTGGSSLALAGGVNIHLRPEMTIATSKASMLSPDGRCKSFDARANGYVRAEGTGVVVLKRLSDAIADGNSIYATIRGSVVNQDGRTKGITVPNGDAQQAAIRNAYRLANVSPKDIQYVEAHGTGTPVGDPIEVNALGAAFGSDRENECLIGSVKSNIGHTESAAGVAGVIKVALALKHGQIPPNLHFESANPNIDFEALRFRVPQEVEPWPDTHGELRMASVNSFGFGGTNAHVVLSEAPVLQKDKEEDTAVSDNKAFLLPLSARSQESLTELARKYSHFLQESDAELRDICTSASQYRQHHFYRLTIVGHDKAEMAERLDNFLINGQDTYVGTGQAQTNKLTFVFSGMGPQWWAMGRQLLAEEPVFRQVIEACDKLLSDYADYSLLQILTASEEESRINETRFAQPGIFAIQIGLAALWRFWGVTPDAIIGHSVGEVAAAYVSGALSLADAIQVIYHRSRLQQTTAGMGKMLAVGMSLDSVQPYLADYSDVVSIAAINSPDSITLSGDEDALLAIEEQIKATGAFCRLLRVEVPYHSPKMDLIRDELLTSLQDIKPQQTHTTLYSTALGQFVSGTEIDAAYWWQNVRNPVQFAKSMSALADAETTLFLEVSPHPVLMSSIKECLQKANQMATVLFSLRRLKPERATLLHTLGQLYAHGYEVEWQEIVNGRFTQLPFYAWQRQRYWEESDVSMQDRIGQPMRRTALGEQTHPLLGAKLNLAHSDAVWDAVIDPENLAYLNDHKVQSYPVYPGAAYIEMALAARHAVNHKDADLLDDIEFLQALFLLPEQTTTLQLILSDNNFKIFSRQDEQQIWTQHAGGQFAIAKSELKVIPIRINGNGALSSTNGHTKNSYTTLDVEDVQQRCQEAVSQIDCYQEFNQMGLQYGPQFQGISQLWRNADEAVGQFQFNIDPSENYHLHPTVLDACFQLLLSVMIGNDVVDQLYLPIHIAHLQLHGDPTQGVWGYGRLQEVTDSNLLGDVQLFDQQGNLLVDVQGIRCVSVGQLEAPKAAKTVADEESGIFHVPHWIESPLAEMETAVKDEDDIETAVWLIFADSKGIGQTLATQLKEKQQRAILITPSDSYQQQGDTFQIRPDQPEDIQQILNTVGYNRPYQAAIHLWNLDVPQPAVDLDQTLGAESVLHLVQAIANMMPLPKLWLVTQGAQAVDEQLLQIQQAPTWGMSQVITLELPTLHCVRIDLDPTTDESAAVQIMQEIEHVHVDEQIAYRQGTRYTAQLMPFTPTVGNDPHIIEEGSYLITGGLGDLGLLFAKYLIEKGARHLILTGRRGAIGKETAVADLEQMGATILVVAADVSEQADVKQLIEKATDSMPPLRGIIHAAGVIDDGTLLKQTAARFRHVMAPKMAGAWYLHSYTQDLPLDFFVCFSSVASLFGSPGQGNYAAGNAFMDALMHHRHALGLPGLSINWGPWAEVGMAVNVLSQLATRGLDAISVAQGVDGMGRLLQASDSAQIGVVAVNWSKFLTAFGQEQNPYFAPYLHLIKNKQKDDAFLMQLQATPTEECPAMLLSHVEKISKTVLGFTASQQINVEQSLFSLGLDSLMAVEIRNKLETSLHLTLRSTLLFDYSTINALVGHMIEQLNLTTVAQVEDDAVADLMAELDDYSEEELARLLAEELSDV